MSSPRQGQNVDFDIISAIASRDAAVEDIVRESRNRGVKSLEDILDMVRQAVARRDDSPKAAPDPLNFKKFSVGADYKPRRDIVHSVPEIPVLIDGVMFDPKDIKRFDGQELHFIAARDRQSMIAIADRAVMGKWWEMTYVTSLTNSASSAPRALASHFSLPEPAAIYYEDDNFGGSSISHGKNRGFSDLTRLKTRLGQSWADRISSLRLINLTICVLHWDIHWQGPTMTFQASTPFAMEPVSYPFDLVPSLTPFGANDRANSVEGW